MSNLKSLQIVIWVVCISFGLCLAPGSLGAQEGISIANFKPSTSIGSLFELKLQFGPRNGDLRPGFKLGHATIELSFPSVRKRQNDVGISNLVPDLVDQRESLCK